MYFRIEVSFPLNVETMVQDTKRVEHIVDMQASDAGAGFGMRDVGFVVATKEEVATVIRKLLDGGYVDISCRTHRRDE